MSIYFVDAIIGLVVAIGIFIDAVGLLREAISASRGEEEDYSEYKLPLEECWEENKKMAFQNWILYILWGGQQRKREEIVSSLGHAFKPENYIPVLSELNATVKEVHDFDEIFDELIEPLEKEKLLTLEEEVYTLSDVGDRYLKDFMANFDYYDVHLSDTILLAMAEDAENPQ